MPARRSRLGDKSEGGGGKLTVGIVVSLHRMLWTFAYFERCTSQWHPHIVWKLLMSCVRWTARNRACVWFYARDFCWTMQLLVLFTDVWVPKSGTRTARSYTKSEYTQSLIDMSRTLFDGKITHR